MISLGASLHDLQVVLLMFARISAIMTVAPIFGHRAVPAVVRALLGGFVAVLFYIAGVGGGIQVPAPFGVFLLLAVQEIAFGVLIGFLASLLFAGIGMAAELVGRQAAFGFANVVDPLSQEQGTIIDQLYLLLAALVFLAVDGHHALLRAIKRSYDFVPVGTFMARTGPEGDLLLNQVLNAVSLMFEITLRLALPALAVLFVVDLATAILARTIPQMPVFLVGAPAKLLVGLIILIVTLPPVLHVMTLSFEQVFVVMFQAMRVASG